MTGTLLDWPMLSVSIFNALVMFWLGLAVLLNAARRTWGTWLVGSGLLGGAAFFISHSAILGIGRDFFSRGIDLWWRLGWPPLIFLPLAWYFACLWFGGFPEDPSYRDRHIKWAGAVSFLSVSLFAGLFIPDLVPTFSQLAMQDLTSPFSVAGFPLIMLAFPIYITASTGLSIAALMDRSAGQGESNSGGRSRALPWLVAGSISLLMVSLMVSGALGWVALGQPNLANPAGFESTIAWLDLVVSSVLSFTVVFVGQAVVAYEVFSGAILPRGGLRRGWRRILILAIVFSISAGWAAYAGLDPVYGFLFSGVLMTAFLGLMLWRSFQERGDFLEKVRPFVSSHGVYSLMLDGDSGQVSPQRALEALGHNLLGASQAFLVPRGAYASLITTASYPAGSPLPENLPDPGATEEKPFVNLGVGKLDWAIGLWPEASSGGTLFLGPKTDGGLYIQEELELAQTAAERILDSAAGAELARRLALLQKERLVETRITDQRTRRFLHDSVLPQLHAALLSLPDKQVAAEMISGVHRQISDLLLEMPPPTRPSFEEQGLYAALRRLGEEEMAGQFERMEFSFPARSENCVRKLTGTQAEVVFYAVREALRNAARHARGEAPLQVKVVGRCSDSGQLVLSVVDDGIGFGRASGGEPESGRGLILHGALVALIGGEMSVESQPEGGTAVHIRL